MKKSQIISISALIAMMALSACGPKIVYESSNHDSYESKESYSKDSKEDDSKENSSESKGEKPSSSVGGSSSQAGSTSNNSVTSSSTGGYFDDEEYTISVPSVTGVKATLSKPRAKAGETVTLTLELDAGYKVTSVTSNTAKIEKVRENFYQFVMPDRSVRISIMVEMQGDIVLSGEIAAAFEKVEGKNLYVAKNVKVESSKEMVGFDVLVADGSGNKTKLKTTAFDEARSFADVESAYPSTYALTIASGSTYDFYYEPDAEFPLYVIRTKVDVIPETAKQIYSLFSGRLRSSPAVHPTNLVGIDYTFSSPSLSYTYNYKLYENNVSYGKVLDNSDPENPQTYFTYKKADLTNNLYTAVTTWTKAKGNNENSDYIWNLDPYKDDDTLYYQPYAAKLDITATDTDNDRREISVRDALRNVRAGAHYGADLEYEFYDTYRSVYDGNVIINAAQNYDLKIETKTNADGSFDTTINSYTEYNYDATANTADATAHEGNVHVVKMHFLSNGALEELDCKKTYYPQNQWDFKNHKPMGAGEVTHFTAKNTFGDEYKGAPEFDENPYFIKTIKSVSWYNKLTKQPESTSESHVNFADALEIIPYANKGKKVALCNSFNYEPATALDAWQYKVTASSDTSKFRLNGRNVFEAVGTGSANVTISNGVNNSNGAKFTTKVTAYASGTFHQLFIDMTKPGYDSYLCDNSSILEAYAGKTTTYYVGTSSNTGAPTVYELYFATKNKFGVYEFSTENEYITVVQTGQTLILDCNNENALALKEVYSIQVKVLSDFYLDGWGPDTWTINVNPKNPEAKDVVGTSWIFDHYVDRNNNPLDDYTVVQFSSTFADETNEIRYGKVVDHAFEKGTEYISTWTFVYQIAKSGKIQSRITNFETNDPAMKGEPYYYFGMDFGGFKNNLLMVALWYDGQNEYGDILGVINIDGDDQVYVESYYGFTQQK